MKCPFCGEEMEHGFIYGTQTVGFPWYPDGKKPLIYLPDINLKKKGGMVFGKTEVELIPACMIILPSQYLSGHNLAS